MSLGIYQVNKLLHKFNNSASLPTNAGFFRQLVSDFLYFPQEDRKEISEFLAWLVEQNVTEKNYAEFLDNFEVIYDEYEFKLRGDVDEVLEEASVADDD